MPRIVAYFGCELMFRIAAYFGWDFFRSRVWWDSSLIRCGWHPKIIEGGHHPTHAPSSILPPCWNQYVETSENLHLNRVNTVTVSNSLNIFEDTTHAGNKGETMPAIMKCSPLLSYIASCGPLSLSDHFLTGQLMPRVTRRWPAPRWLADTFVPRNLQFEACHCLWSQILSHLGQFLYSRVDIEIYQDDEMLNFCFRASLKDKHHRISSFIRHIHIFRFLVPFLFFGPCTLLPSLSLLDSQIALFDTFWLFNQTLNRFWKLFNSMFN